MLKKLFSQEGYCILDNAIPLDDILNFKKTLHKIILIILKKYNINLNFENHTSLENQCDLGLIALRKSNSEYPNLVQAIISRSPEYYRICSAPAIIDAVKMLLNLEKDMPIYLTNNGIIFTLPNDEKNQTSSNINTEWHKDTFFTIPRSRYLHVWAPLLHDATTEIGTLQICPGSHKEGIGIQKIYPNLQYDHRYKMKHDESIKYETKSIALKLGQALIFDGNLIHRSGKNTSNHVRCTLIGLHHNVLNKKFHPLNVSYGYSQQTPEEYYYEIFKDDEALCLLHEQKIS